MTEFKKFCQDAGIQHETSSPHFQSANGGAERAIQTVKRLWRKSEDRQLALLDYRTTPLEGLNLSPAQLLMGRRLRNTLPASKELLRPGNHDTQKVKKHFDEQKAKQKFYHDHRRGVKGLPPLNKGIPVRISPLPGTNNWLPGKVVTHYNKPRSYVVQAGNWLYRRNRKHLRVSTEVANATRDDEDTDLHVDTPPPDPLHQGFSTSGSRPHLGSPSDFRGVARLSTNFLKNDGIFKY